MKLKKILFSINFMVLGIAVLLNGCSKNPGEQSQTQAKTVTSCCKDTCKKKILVVHSYYTDYPWVQSVTRGIRMILNSQDVDLQFYYMDTKRNPDKEWMVGQGQKVLSIIGQWGPDIVITVDDNAQEFVGKKLVGWDDLSVVFCGVNTDPKEYGYPSTNVTGVMESPHFKESTSFLKEILGKEGSLRLVVMSDSSETTDFAFKFMQSQVDSNVNVINWCKLATWQEWRQSVQQAQTQADAIAVYLYHTILPNSDSKQSMNPGDVIGWTVANSKIPIVGFLPFSSDDGSLCGVLESGLEQGRTAGRMAMEILKGKAPCEIAIQNGLSGQSMLNLSIAGRLGIPVSGDIIDHVDILIGKDDKAKSL